MRLFSVRFPGQQPSGYVAKCSRCGALVVHAASTGKPLHMHAKSRKCAESALQSMLRPGWFDYFEIPRRKRVARKKLYKFEKEA